MKPERLIAHVHFLSLVSELLHSLLSLLLGSLSISLEIAEFYATVRSNHVMRYLRLLEEADEVRSRHVQVVCRLLRGEFGMHRDECDCVPLRHLGEEVVQKRIHCSGEQQKFATINLNAKLSGLGTRKGAARHAGEFCIIRRW